MAFPPQYREPAPTLPSIVASGNARYRAHHDVPFGRSPAISIPGLELREQVPPPLPPPRVLPFVDALHPQQPEAMNRDRREHHPTPSSFASGYGSMGSCADDRPNLKRRDTGSTTNGDEGYASFTCAERTREPLPPEIGLHHNKFYFQTPADLHTDSIKRKLDPVRNFDKSPPRSVLTSSMSDLPRRHADARLPPALNMPVQLPIHSRPIFDSPSRLTDTSPYSAISPRSAAPFRQSPVDHRLRHDPSDFLDRSPKGRSRRNNSDDATSTQGSYEFTGAEDMEMDEASLRRLHIDDAYAAAGQKRRAASPPALEMPLHCASGQSDVVRRRDAASRGSPTPRLAANPQASSVSSMPPAAVSRPGSYMSTVSMPSVSTTPANSYGRRSPGCTSPGGISPTSCNSPYAASASLTHSPRIPVSARVAMHIRTISVTSPKKFPEMQKHLQGFLMCDCCPKKPKRFEIVEELRAHEAEKQYECLFCGNRFKNKNEAERHQNSLHVRRHSWSCSALSGYDRAFHDSTNRPGEADTCGYCGDDFPRSGRGPGGAMVPKHATEQDWEQRIRHLQDLHKFRECNSAKKFYRADHFRQHLKHSHAGTSGKWTNMLENACMVEEGPSPR